MCQDHTRQYALHVDTQGEFQHLLSPVHKSQAASELHHCCHFILWLFGAQQPQHWVLCDVRSSGSGRWAVPQSKRIFFSLYSLHMATSASSNVLWLARCCKQCFWYECSWVTTPQKWTCASPSSPVSPTHKACYWMLLRILFPSDSTDHLSWRSKGSAVPSADPANAQTQRPTPSS